MSHIIVVFPRRDNAVNIRNVLVRAGMEVSAVCLTGAKVLQYVDNWSDGIVVCGYHLQDMQYTELREALPFSFDMLLVAPHQNGWMNCRRVLWDCHCRSRSTILSVQWKCFSSHRKEKERSGKKEAGKEMMQKRSWLTRRKHY